MPVTNPPPPPLSPHAFLKLKEEHPHVLLHQLRSLHLRPGPYHFHHAHLQARPGEQGCAQGIGNALPAGSGDLRTQGSSPTHNSRPEVGAPQRCQGARVCDPGPFPRGCLRVPTLLLVPQAHKWQGGGARIPAMPVTFIRKAVPLPERSWQSFARISWARSVSHGPYFREPRKEGLRLPSLSSEASGTVSGGCLSPMPTLPDER